jgi:methylmalonyl-CoA/ethylmalonyl-CoA epimerase
MWLMELDHVGFLTNDVDEEMARFDLLFRGTVWSAKIIDPIQDVIARFGRTPQGLVYELLQANSLNSPIAQALKARKNILNHICYRCLDLSAKADELRAQGFFPVTEAKTGIAFGNNPIQFFFHPNGLLLEMVEGTAGPFDQMK